MKIWKRLAARLSGHVLAPEDEAAWMIQARTGRSVFTHPFTPLLPEDEIVLLQWVEKRRTGRSLGYLTGTAFFWGKALSVVPGVFIPRPESEALVRAFLEHAPGGMKRVVDLGTGSGALLLAVLLERDEVLGLGVDCSSLALAVARANANRWGVARRARFIRADAGRLPLLSDSVDGVIANPPYVPEGWQGADPALQEEPPEALYSPEGVAHLRTWLTEVLRVLRPGGVGAVEFSSVVAEGAEKVLKDAGVEYGLVRDLSGEIRGAVFRRT